MSRPLWLTFSSRRILMSVVSKGLRFFAPAWRPEFDAPKLWGKLEEGLWNVAEGETLSSC